MKIGFFGNLFGHAARGCVQARIPGWGSVAWKKVITGLSMIGYDYVMSYEHEDVTMSRQDGIPKTIAYWKPPMIEKPYKGRNDVLFA